MQPNQRLQPGQEAVPEVPKHQRRRRGRKTFGVRVTRNYHWFPGKCKAITWEQWYETEKQQLAAQRSFLRNACGSTKHNPAVTCELIRREI